MPIYEYACKDCGKEFEVLQKITAKPITKCKFCGGRVEKLVSNSSFTFKGGGWYITDYRNKSSKKETSTKKGKVIDTKTVNETDNTKKKNNTNKDTSHKKKEHKKVS